MDTLSRDSSSSSNSIVPMIGAITGVVGLLLAVIALVQLSSFKKAVTAHNEEVATKVASIENDVRSATAKMDGDMKNLRDGLQGALNQIGAEIGSMKAQLTKIEEDAKKRAVAAPVAGKGGKAAATGVKNADGTYTIAAGDYPAKIARKFGTTVDAILAENPGLNPNKIHPGQKIRLPAGK